MQLLNLTNIVIISEDVEGLFKPIITQIISLVAQQINGSRKAGAEVSVNIHSFLNFAPHSFFLFDQHLEY